MITTTLVTGTLMFDGTFEVPETAKIFVTLTDGNNTKCEEKQIEFDHKSLAVFKYLPFELRNFEMPEVSPVRVSASITCETPAKYRSREPVEIKTGLEDVLLNMVRA